MEIRHIHPEYLTEEERQQKLLEIGKRCLELERTREEPSGKRTCSKR